MNKKFFCVATYKFNITGKSYYLCDYLILTENTNILTFIENNKHCYYFENLTGELITLHTVGTRKQAIECCYKYKEGFKNNNEWIFDIDLNLINNK